MTEQLERELRQLFAEDAEHSPTSESLALGARRQVRHRRRAQFAWVGGAAVATVAAVAIVSSGVFGGELSGDKVATPPASAPPVSGATGPLPDGGMASCVEQYSPVALAGRAFAFDGTVASITSEGGDQPSTGQDTVAVTFEVNEWYEGGSGATVSVDITPPEAVATTEDAPPIYEVGSRLLVSGEPLFGGPPLKDAIAWGCGFTRYYDESTASSWRNAFS